MCNCGHAWTKHAIDEWDRSYETGGQCKIVECACTRYVDAVLTMLAAREGYRG